MKNKNVKTQTAGAMQSPSKSVWDKAFPFVTGALVLVIVALIVAIILVKVGAFDAKPEDLSKYAPELASEEQYSEGNYKYALLKDGNAIITGLVTEADGVSELHIPSEIGGKKVTAIADKSFYLEMQINRVIIPEGVTYIGYQAFYGCVRLEMLSLPSTLTVIRECAFESCGYLDGVSFGGTHEAWSGVKIGENNSALSYVLALG